MSSFRIEAMISGRAITFDVEGERFYGGDEVLLDRDDDVIRDTPWADRGYCVAPFLDDGDLRAIREGFRARVEGYLRACGARERLDDLEHYHRHTVIDGVDRHLDVVENVRHGLPISGFPIPFERVEQRISEICGLALQVRNPVLDRATYSVRLVRPGRGDFNPPHRDVWLDRLRNAVNVYVPLAGSTADSSLCLVPGSHRWKESEIERTAQGARINGVPFTVPAVTRSSRGLELIRPNPAASEVLVFSPYLVHGGAANLNTDATRVSLEIRFWRKPTA